MQVGLLQVAAGAELYKVPKPLNERLHFVRNILMIFFSFLVPLVYLRSFVPGFINFKIISEIKELVVKATRLLLSTAGSAGR